jgi:pimeloyl-ACP methyl ester carboxylesterase
VTRIAVDHPELVSCLVNVDTGIVPDSLALVKQTLPFLTYIASTAVPSGGPVPESIRREIALRTPSGHNVTAAHIDRIWRLWQSPTHSAARAATRAAGMTPAGGYFRGLKAQLLADIGAGRLTVPHLLVWGRDDPQVPLVAGLELFALLNRGRSTVELAVIANAGHEVFMEYPADFNRIVTGFCAGRE